LILKFILIFCLTWIFPYRNNQQEKHRSITNESAVDEILSVSSIEVFINFKVANSLRGLVDLLFS